MMTHKQIKEHDVLLSDTKANLEAVKEEKEKADRRLAGWQRRQQIARQSIVIVGEYHGLRHIRFV